MYAVDGVPLQNPTLGWRLKRATEPWVTRGISQADFNASNRDGTISVRGHVTTPTVTLVVTAPSSNVESLRRLLRLGRSLTAVAAPGIELQVEAVTITHETITPVGAGVHQVTVVYRAPGVWWRDIYTTDWVANLPVANGVGAANMQVLTPTTGAVHDALILIQGSMNTVRFAGVSNTWLQITGLINGWTRIDTERGRAWSGSTNDGSNPWTNTAFEITSYVNSGAYPYFLELAPPSVGAAASTLAISWNSVPVATTITVRAKNSYDR